MSTNFYKQVILSQLIISGWILYGFFDYFMDKDETGFAKLGVLFYFFESCIWLSGIGLLLAILRVTSFKKARKHILVKTFIYVFTGIFNGYLVIIWLVSGILGLIEFDNWLSITFPLVALISASVIFYDFYKIRFSEKPDIVIDPVE